jgi:hypothetical protein
MSRHCYAIKSVPLGKYCRSNPFVFSLAPCCQGLCGSQKYTFSSVATVKLSCLAISSPRPQVNERRGEFPNVLAQRGHHHRVSLLDTLTSMAKRE